MSAYIYIYIYIQHAYIIFKCIIIILFACASGFRLLFGSLMHVVGVQEERTLALPCLGNLPNLPTYHHQQQQPLAQPKKGGDFTNPEGGNSCNRGWMISIICIIHYWFFRSPSKGLINWVSSLFIHGGFEKISYVATERGFSEWRVWTPDTRIIR